MPLALIRWEIFRCGLCIKSSPQEKGVATAPEDPVAKKPKVAKGRKASKEIVVADDES